MSAEENIDSFFGWVNDQRKEINDLTTKCPSSCELYRRILLLSLLDMLSKCAFPNEVKNRKRFVRLIDCYSDWKYKDYVSLSQLRCILIKKGVCQKLRSEIEKRINNLVKGEIHRPEKADITIQELANFKCTKCEKLIEDARYSSLLWQMRNYALHEFRRVGRGMASISSNHSTPFIHELQELNGSVSWELYIPSNVISQITQNSSNNLEQKFRTEARDPYDAFSYGSNWYP